MTITYSGERQLGRKKRGERREEVENCEKGDGPDDFPSVAAVNGDLDSALRRRTYQHEHQREDYDEEHAFEIHLFLFFLFEAD